MNLLRPTHWFGQALHALREKQAARFVLPTPRRLAGGISDLAGGVRQSASTLFGANPVRNTVLGAGAAGGLGAAAYMGKDRSDLPALNHTWQGGVGINMGQYRTPHPNMANNYPVSLSPTYEDNGTHQALRNARYTYPVTPTMPPSPTAAQTSSFPGWAPTGHNYPVDIRRTPIDVPMRSRHLLPVMQDQTNAQLNRHNLSQVSPYMRGQSAAVEPLLVSRLYGFSGPPGQGADRQWSATDLYPDPPYGWFQDSRAATAGLPPPFLPDYPVDLSTNMIRRPTTPANVGGGPFQNRLIEPPLGGLRPR